MAGVTFLKCPNCDFQTRISGGFPFYTDKESGERVYPMVPLPLEFNNKIEGYKGSSYCGNCRKPVEIIKHVDQKAPPCPECGKSNFVNEKDPCPICKVSKLEASIAFF